MSQLRFKFILPQTNAFVLLIKSVYAISILSIAVLGAWIPLGSEGDNLSVIKKRFEEEWKKKNFPFSFEFGSGEEFCKNDWNKDGIEDFAFTMRVKQTDSSDEKAMDQNGFLGIALGDPKGNYRFDSMIPMIPCNACGGVYGRPEITLQCSGGKIKVNSYGGSNWRWSNSETIRFKSSAWQWIGSDTYSYHTSFGDGLKHSFNRINLDSSRSYDGKMESEQESIPPRKEIRFKKILSSQTQNGFSFGAAWDFLPVLPFEIQDRNWMIGKNNSWKGPQDLSFRIRSGWNSQFLALQVSVKDDQIRFCNSQFASRDCDRVEFTADLDSTLLDFDTNAGLRKKIGPKGILLSFRILENGKIEILRNGKKYPKEDVEAALQSSSDGYTIRFKIPWKTFGKENVSGLSEGFKFLASVAVLDFDGDSKPLQKMATSEIEDQDPYTLGELELISGKYSLGTWKQEN
ncbi:sugar-binding protein [Leptospira barantonii]|uniref:Carbohydrate-binding domain-containing protein n=1 Tax=Leptospira barantonii TaxID=2023184 RepID=A0ABX4NPG4_9LEPT|nr:sugar-binding protein [Leptospira barantonii]PJZ58730.1 hypothetical protein CH367_01365 [Leptospira barantonii]